MLEFEEIMQDVKSQLKPKRYFHTLGVVITSAYLARLYGESIEKARLAALLHDCSRNGITEDEMLILAERSLFADEYKEETKGINLLHSVASEVVAREKYGICDREVLRAVRFHTTGRRNMTKLEMIVYSADMIEPSREYEGVEKLRRLERSGLEELTFACCGHTVDYLKAKNCSIHGATLDLYRWLEEKQKD